jgi:enoyl-CoA hydratase/carnithine racemase
MLSQMHQAFEDLHQEKNVRAVILTGAGEFFSAGSDLLEIKNSMQDEDSESKWFADCMAQKDLVETMLRFPKPIIAAVNGPALGLGAALVMASDVAIAAEGSSFGFPETRRGLVAGIAAPLLAFRLGAAAAADFLLRGEMASGRECFEIGIYRSIVAEDLVWAKADAIARELTGKGSEAVSMTKRLLNEAIGEHLFTQLSAGAAATATARTTDAAAEGIDAFFEKRDPEW